LNTIYNHFYTTNKVQKELIKYEMKKKKGRNATLFNVFLKRIIRYKIRKNPDYLSNKLWHLHSSAKVYLG